MVNLEVLRRHAARLLESRTRSTTRRLNILFESLLFWLTVVLLVYAAVHRS